MKLNLNHIRRLSIVLLLVSLSAFAQEKTISGKVIDNSGLPLPGVSVIVKGTSQGTSSDFDGIYQFKANINAESVLVFSYVGMITAEEKINGRTTIDVTLEENT